MDRKPGSQHVTDVQKFGDGELVKRVLRRASRPAGAVIEVVERRTAPPDGSVGDEVIVPDEIRINGQPLLIPTGVPVTVHEMEMQDRGVVLVTLTVVAKRVVIGAEYPDEEETRRADRNEEYREKLANHGLIPEAARPDAKASA
jgi:hypothetical protein